jgi:hypothetical protein
MIIYLDPNIVFYQAFAISSFSRVPLTDSYYPCDQFGYNNNASENLMIESECLDDTDRSKLFNLPLPVDIIGMTYLSTGETFNATLWLDYPLYDNKFSDYVDANLTFIMSINDIIRGEYDVTLEPINFIYIYPEQEGNWTYKFFETNPFDYKFYEADPFERTKEILIESNYNYNNFYQNGKKFVHIPFNLNSLGNPEEFAVQFRMSINTDYSGLNFLKNKGKEFLIDTTNWDSIPPGELQITFNEPSDIKVAAGEGKKVDERVLINAIGLNVPEVMLLSDGNKDDGIDLSFNPSQIILPFNGTKNTEMIIDETSKELEPKKYDTISVNVTRGLINPNNLSELIDPISYTEAVTIQILPPLPPLPPIVQLNNIFLNNYGISIYIILFSIPLGITTIFAFLLTRRFNPQIILDKIGIQDLLTIDGSVIVGVLILLTLNTAEGTLKEASTLIAILTTTIIIPFALSALITLIKGSVEIGIKLAIPGFIYLMVSIVIVAYIQFQSSI